jgi:chromosome segregation protein
MENAINMARRNKYAFRIVTLDGDIINSSGQMSGGSLVKKTTSILSRGREIEDLKKLVDELKYEKEGIQKEFEEYKSSASDLLRDEDAIVSEFQEVQVVFATEQQKMLGFISNIEKHEKKISSLQEEKDSLVKDIENVGKEIEEINSLLTNIDKENEDAQSQVDEFAKKNMDQQKMFDDLNSDIMDLKISVSSFDESKSSIDEILERIKNEIEEATSSIESKKEDIQKMTENNATFENDIKDLEGKIEESNEKIKEISQQLQDQKDERESKNAKAISLEKDLENEYRTLDVLHEQTNKLEIKKSKIETEIEDIQNKMWEEYEVTPNTATNYDEVTPHTGKDVEKLKASIKELGPINVNSIEEYKAVGDRYEFLRGQKLDLEESQSSLEKIITDMVELMKIQFAQKFELINKNFGEVFVELFGGGRAELILSDTSNVLESGIEIEVQPPGKKLQNMMLLSGGERAFTAIALLFAILKLSPSPFCILDEIEAALDDVNVYRFSDYLKKFSESTQFLLITHRKGSMEAADIVYGATMQEHGITKLVSMKLNETE